MASNGSFVTNEKSGRSLTLNWSLASQDIANNTSTINWSLVGSGSASGYVYGGTFSVVINGNTVYSSANRIQIYNGTVIASGTITIPHNSDGSKNFSASVSAAIYDYAVNAWGSSSWDLTTIPRASSFTLSSSNFEIGTSISIAISRASTAFAHRIILAFGSYSVTLSTNATTSYTWATGSYLSNMATQIPSAVSGVGQITVETYNGSALIGTSSKAFTASLASSVVPTCGALSVSEANSIVSALSAGYIKGQSKLLIAIGASNSIHGATIKGYKITANNQTFTTQTATTDALSNSGTLTITATVTDSRGRTASKNASITVVDYTSPTITATATRKVGATTTMVVTITGTITSLSSKNIATYAIKSKLKSGSSYTTVASNVEITGTTINTSKELTTYAVASSYDVQVIVTDKLSSTTILLTLPTEAVILDVNKSGIGIGKYRENGVLDVNADLTTIYSKGTTTLKTLIVNLVYPVGAIYLSVNSTSPATLFGGTWVAWGTGRVPVGINTSDTDFSTIEKTGGAKTHTLTAGQLPGHAHLLVGGWYQYGGGVNGTSDPSWWATNGGSSGHNFSSQNKYTASTGEGQAHNNLQPYITCYMWKRTA